MRNRKNMIIAAICIAVLFMVTVYSLLQTNLNITGVGNITTTWGVEISKITRYYI